MKIRTCCEADIPAITEIYSEQVTTGTASFETEPPDAAEMLRRWSEIQRQGYPYLVAEMDGRTIGYAYASPYRTRAAYRFTVEDSVYVDPAFHGQGIGRALLSALIAACVQRGDRQMVAVIGGTDNAASVRLHEGLGFRHVGVLQGVGFKFGKSVDTILMQRAL